jgi:Domain of unknown function (DUF4115)
VDRAERVFVVVGFIAVAVLAFFTALAWRDYHDNGSTPTGTTRRQTTRAAPQLPRPAVAGVETSISRPPPAPEQNAPRRTPASSANKLVLRATRGESWVSMHAVSEAGPTLYEGVLAQGKAVSATKKVIWLRIGAPTFLDARLNGRAVPLPPSTATLVARRGRLTTLALG